MTGDLKPPSAFMRTFAVPAVIAIASLVGLSAALLGDGGYDVISWLGLGVPVATIAWAMLKRPS